MLCLLFRCFSVLLFPVFVAFLICFCPRPLLIPPTPPSHVPNISIYNQGFPGQGIGLTVSSFPGLGGLGLKRGAS